MIVVKAMFFKDIDSANEFIKKECNLGILRTYALDFSLAKNYLVCVEYYCKVDEKGG